MAPKLWEIVSGRNRTGNCRPFPFGGIFLVQSFPPQPTSTWTLSCSILFLQYLEVTRLFEIWSQRGSAFSQHRLPPAQVHWQEPSLPTQTILPIEAIQATQESDTVARSLSFCLHWTSSRILGRIVLWHKWATLPLWKSWPWVLTRWLRDV